MYDGMSAYEHRAWAWAVEVGNLSDDATRDQAYDDAIANGTEHYGTPVDYLTSKEN